jgi:hypothetical protein
LILCGAGETSTAGPQASRTGPLRGVGRCLPPHLFIF